MINSNSLQVIFTVYFYAHQSVKEQKAILFLVNLKFYVRDYNSEIKKTIKTMNRRPVQICTEMLNEVYRWQPCQRDPNVLLRFIYNLWLQETTGVCLHELHSGTCYKRYKLSPGTILKQPPIELLLGSVEMGYPLNSTCSDIDTELCVRTRVSACVCFCSQWRRSILSSCNMTNYFSSLLCGRGNGENGRPIQFMSESLYIKVLATNPHFFLPHMHMQDYRRSVRKIAFCSNYSSDRPHGRKVWWHWSDPWGVQASNWKSGLWLYVPKGPEPPVPIHALAHT